MTVGRELYDQPALIEQFSEMVVPAEGGKAMALLLDGQRLTSQTRTERLLQAITFDTVIKAAPVASIAGVPLAFLSAKNYMVAYATHFGIPEQFVKVDPMAAIAPFSFIAGLLLLGLVLLHEVERFGLAEALKTYGRAARSLFFLGAILAYASCAIRPTRDCRRRWRHNPALCAAVVGPPAHFLDRAPAPQGRCLDGPFHPY